MALQSRVGNPSVSFIGKLANDKASYSQGALASVKLPVGAGVFGTSSDNVTNVKPNADGHFLGIVLNSGTIQSERLLGNSIYVDQGEQCEFLSRGQVFTAIAPSSGDDAPKFGNYVYVDDTNGVLLYSNTVTDSITNATLTPFRVVQVHDKVTWEVTSKTCYLALLSTNYF